MDRRNFLAASAGAAFSLAASRLAAGAAQSRPNFIFFLADDLGWADVETNGSEFYRTPSLKRLAGEGVSFTDAYAAAPVCSPTRASIMSGKYPARVGVTDYIGGWRPGRLIPPENLGRLPLEEVTIGEAFAAAGYDTCFIGKWHLGGEDYYPDRQGFGENIGGAHMGHPPGGHFPPYGIPTLPDGPPGEYLTDRLTEEALAFLGRPREKPFLLFLSHYAVHIPIQAKGEDIERYEARADELGADREGRFARENGRKTRVVQDHPVYGAMVESLDESLGRVLDKLEESGLAGNTAVIFMSDNGGLSTAEGRPTSNKPLRAGKGWLHEGGIREPMIIKWPGVTSGGEVSEPVTSTDFYPTMLEMADLPARPGQHLDGKSLVPLLLGKPFERGPIFWHYPHYSNQGGRPSGAVRLGDYKLIENYEDWSAELYNLAGDPGEHRDLAGELPDKRDELLGLLRDWRAETGAAMPKPNPLDPRNLFR